VGLKRKISTLLDPEKRLYSYCEHRRRACNQRRPFPLTPEALLARLDRQKLETILSDHSAIDPGIHTVKYLDIETWLAPNIRRVLNLGLDFKSKKRLLDIGSGAGYFLYICKQLGHDVAGLDVRDPSAAWYGKMFELYGIPRTIWYINPLEKLPDLGPRFDCVTGFMICFNQPKGDNAWRIEQWRFFLDDLQTHLKPKAVVWFELNPGLDGAHYSAELREFFESRGAIVDGKRLVWGIQPMEYRILQRLASLEVSAMRKAAMAEENGASVSHRAG
jgi:SAM-dependent methyltransferase